MSRGAEHDRAAIAEREVACDPLVLLKGFTGLRQLTSLYPPGHQIVQQALDALMDTLQPFVDDEPSVRIDVIGGVAHLNDVPFRAESRAHAGVLDEFLGLGFDSLHLTRGVTRDELARATELLARFKDRQPAAPVGPLLVAAGVRHVTLGRLLALDTRWRAREWPDAPTGPIDPDYAESLQRAEDTLGAFAAGQQPGAGAIRDLLRLLMVKVAGSTAALGQILAVKQYENHTYCHSVNVAIISLLIGRRVGLDEPTLAALVEGALLHDVGKTRIPVEIIKKPAKLDQRERAIIERHPAAGAAMLVEVPDLSPLTPTIALEHHRHAIGAGYPDLGEGVVPHLLSQIVSVADVYEAVTGARSYREPALPEQACLILARLAGRQLNTALVKAFVDTVTFFPIGTLVRTTLDEIGVVVRQTPRDPLHPVIALTDGLSPVPRGREIDTSLRDETGAYRRHIVHSMLPAVTAAA